MFTHCCYKHSSQPQYFCTKHKLLHRQVKTSSLHKGGLRLMAVFDRSTSYCQWQRSYGFFLSLLDQKLFMLSDLNNLPVAVGLAIRFIVVPFMIKCRDKTDGNLSKIVKRSFGIILKLED